MGLTLYAWAFEPDYTYSISVDYLNLKSEEVYDIKTSVFLPTFVLFSYAGQDNIVTNDNTLFEWKYIDYATGDDVPAIPCVDLINSMPDLKSEAR